MKTLTYIRHGQSEANAQNIFGSFDSPLTEVGKVQAASAVQKVTIKPDIIVASPQPRALETAQIIAKAIGYESKIIQRDDIVERNYGTLTGTEFTRSADTLDVSADSTAETIEQLYERAESFYTWVKDLPDKNVLVVGHGAFGRAFIRVINAAEHNLHVTFMKNAEPVVLMQS